jgi:hypothetical protein
VLFSDALRKPERLLQVPPSSSCHYTHTWSQYEVLAAKNKAITSRSLSCMQIHDKVSRNVSALPPPPDALANSAYGVPVPPSPYPFLSTPSQLKTISSSCKEAPIRSPQSYSHKTGSAALTRADPSRSNSWQRVVTSSHPRQEAEVELSDCIQCTCVPWTLRV